MTQIAQSYYHFHVVYEGISMLPSFSSGTINAGCLYLLTSIQISQSSCKHLNSVVNQGSFRLQNELIVVLKVLR